MLSRSFKQRFRSVLAVAATLFLGGTLLSGSPAVAADQDITVTPVSAVYSDGITDFKDRQLNRGGRARLLFNWDASNKPGFGTGDKFVIDLGEFFNNYETKTIDLTIPVGQNPSQKIGACVIEQKKVTCTFDENVDRLKGSFGQWKGTVTLLTNVAKGTSEPTVNVGVNGQDFPLTLPVGPKGEIGIGEPKVVPASVYKAASVKEGQKVGDYVIYMSGVRLKAHLGEAFKLNDPNQVVTFRDSLVNAQGEIDGGQVFQLKPHPTDPAKLVPADPQTWILRAVKLEPNAKTYHIDDVRPGANNRVTDETPAEIGEFEVNVEFEKETPHIAIITIKGPFSDLYTYSLSYPTDILNPKGIQEGTVYSNRIDLLGSNHSFQLNRSYRNSATATAEAVPGFGTFAIEKRIFGAAEGLVTNAHTVNVNYAYELPLTADSFAGWQAPGTLNADKKTGKATCTINFRKTTICFADGANPGKLLPKGTKVFITPADEDLASISEEIRDLKWAAPLVTLPNDAAFITIGENGDLPQAIITNKANLKVGKFKVKKTVTGLDNGVQAGPFNFDYSCVNGNNPAVLGRIVGVTANGPAVESDKEFPIGSVCTITEEQPAEVGGYSLALPAKQQVTVDSETVAKEVTFNNVYTKQLAPFAVKKTVTGLDAGVNAGPFDFTYSCQKDREPVITGEITGVEAGGAAKVSDKQFPVGSVCIVIEKTDSAQVEGYSLKPKAPVLVTVGAVGQPAAEAVFNNEYTKVVAPFAVKKTVTGLDAGVNAGPFDFTYSCVKDNGTPVTGEVTGVEAGGAAKVTDKQFPVGSVCTVTEKATSAMVDGYTWKPVAPVTVTVAAADQPVVEAVFANEYTKDLGTFSVKKAVTGLDAFTGTKPTYSFKYVCTKGGVEVGTGDITGVTAGGAAVVADKSFPIGAECVVTEQPVAEIGGYVLAMPPAQTVNINDMAKPVEVTFTNAYTKVVAPFAVKKTVTGLDAGVNAGPFDFTYSCVKDNGTPVTGEVTGVEAGKPAKVTDREFPVGSVCTVTEKEDSAAVKDYTLKPVAPVVVTIAAADQPVVEAVFANEYTKDMATFYVKKSVTGLEANTAVPSFAFTYSCVKDTEPAVEGRIENVPADGTEVPAGKQFPVGSVCTVTEDKAVAQVADYDLAEVAPVVVTLGKKDESFGAVFENAYTKHLGSFVVGKEVKGVAKGVALPAFDFAYSCKLSSGDVLEGKVEQVAAGKVSEPVVVPVGAECEITEADSTAVKGYTLTKPKPITVTVTKQGEEVKAAFVNQYTPIVPKLPKTGVDAGVLGGVAVVLFAAGVVLARKRRA